MACEISVNRNELYKRYWRYYRHNTLWLIAAVSLTACQTDKLLIVSTCQAQDLSCSKQGPAKPEHDIALDHSNQAKHDLRPFICQNGAEHQSRVVGNGHCVAFIRSCSNAPRTALWRPGRKVVDSTLHPGTVIATFNNGRYPNTHGHHAAILINQDERGIWVWDQWLGKPVHRRLIRYRNTNSAIAPANTAQDYRVVLATPTNNNAK